MAGADVAVPPASYFSALVGGTVLNARDEAQINHGLISGSALLLTGHPTPDAVGRALDLGGTAVRRRSGPSMACPRLLRLHDCEPGSQVMSVWTRTHGLPFTLPWRPPGSISRASSSIRSSA